MGRTIGKRISSTLGKLKRMFWKRPSYVLLIDAPFIDVRNTLRRDNPEFEKFSAINTVGMTIDHIPKPRHVIDDLTKCIDLVMNCGDKALKRFAYFSVLFTYEYYPNPHSEIEPTEYRDIDSVTSMLFDKSLSMFIWRVDVVRRSRWTIDINLRLMKSDNGKTNITNDVIDAVAKILSYGPNGRT